MEGRKKKKRDKLREEKTLCIWYETIFSQKTKGLEWNANKMLINKI